MEETRTVQCFDLLSSVSTDQEEPHGSLFSGSWQEIEALWAPWER
jgi:hypothetical protein